MTYVAEDGTGHEVVVRIGRPISDSITGVEHWMCPFQITGVGDDGVKGIFGIDAMQALLLGIHTIPAELAAHIRNRGGRFQHHGEDDVSFVFPCRTVLKYSDALFPPTDN